MAQTIGADGYALLQAIYDESAPCELRQIEAVQLLQKMWIQQFYVEDDVVQWRTKDDLPPSDKMLTSPYDTDARYSHKRSTTWIGYKVHLTETCEADLPCLITHVETTSATTQDVEVVDKIHANLAEQALLPGDHFVDMGYIYPAMYWSQAISKTLTWSDRFGRIRVGKPKIFVSNGKLF